MIKQRYIINFFVTTFTIAFVFGVTSTKQQMTHSLTIDNAMGFNPLQTCAELNYDPISQAEGLKPSHKRIYKLQSGQLCVKRNIVMS